MIINLVMTQSVGISYMAVVIGNQMQIRITCVLSFQWKRIDLVAK